MPVKTPSGAFQTQNQRMLRALKKKQDATKAKLADMQVGIGRLQAAVSRKESSVRAKNISNKEALEFGRKAAKSLIAGTIKKNKAKKAEMTDKAFKIMRKRQIKARNK